MEITANGKSYIINPLENETDRILSTRAWFIIKQEPKTDIDFQEAEKWSIIWYYMTYYKCRYDPKLENQVKKLRENLYI